MEIQFESNSIELFKFLNEAGNWFQLLYQTGWLWVDMDNFGNFWAFAETFFMSWLGNQIDRIRQLDSNVQFQLIYWINNSNHILHALRRCLGGEETALCFPKSKKGNNLTDSEGMLPKTVALLLQKTYTSISEAMEVASRWWNDHQWTGLKWSMRRYLAQGYLYFWSGVVVALKYRTQLSSLYFYYKSGIYFTDLCWWIENTGVHFDKFLLLIAQVLLPKYIKQGWGVWSSPDVPEQLEFFTVIMLNVAVGNCSAFLEDHCFPSLIQNFNKWSSVCWNATFKIVMSIILQSRVII